MRQAPALVVAAASSHSGKTTVSLGLIAALRARGLNVAAAKCGPDYIDPKFLEAATGRPAINLDPWAMPPVTLRARLAAQGEGLDLVVVEGVMGLYDGGHEGAGSTAALARALGLPVLLVIGAAGLAQTAAAIAEGCRVLADGFAVAGAIVNNVASERHAALIREGFARGTVPLLGLVRRDPSLTLASRHLGLVQAEEHGGLAALIARAGERIAEWCDLEALLKVTAPQPSSSGKRSATRGPRATEPWALGSSPSVTRPEAPSFLPPLGQRIAVARDVAFAFAYPHLLADWRDAGAELAFFSPLADEAPTADVDAIFLPGGYPELHAGRLAAAERFRAGMHAAAARGALVYGECGGYMALGDILVDADGATHRMLGLLPLATSFAERRLQLGYRVLTPLGGLPWTGPLAAHEFHFATIVSEGEGNRLFTASDPAGVDLGAIGLRPGRVMGSFAHVIDAIPRR